MGGNTTGERPEDRETPGEPGGGGQGILVLAPHEAAFEGLLRALRAHFPGHAVALADRPATADGGGRLVLLHPGAGRDFAPLARECRRLFPAAAIGLISEDVEADAVCDAIIGERLVEGWLPISLQLEVWLAAAALLLAGGEYYPVALLQRLRDRSVAGAPAGWQPALGRRRGRAGSAQLTLRERQVLELVSKGYQNRLIANRMALSEHTVKVHVHNLIKKLHVTNRTQAAATWRSGSIDELPSAGMEPDADGRAPKPGGAA